jgi:UDP-2-acetamido-2,6-beta-L-arabino-hexul-4-ose reductase
MKVLITGADGFIGKNLRLRLAELQEFEIYSFNRSNTLDELESAVYYSDVIVHLAGVNRARDPDEFIEGNTNLTEQLCSYIKKAGRKIPLLISSSTQAAFDNPYGLSKRSAEDIAKAFVADTGNPVTIYRLPNVFGKWCKPDYNSVVATFCHNISHDLPIQISDPVVRLNLVYVDDVITTLISQLQTTSIGLSFGIVEPAYSITISELAAQIQAFKNSRSSLVMEKVGVGLVRALYATYISYLSPDRFAYDLPKYIDERGMFVEMLKTKESGQFSFFTAHPGVTRGGHYHHTKTEKFLVIKGEARFGFRNILSNEHYELTTSGDKLRVVETVPGWAHDITNIGKDEMVVILWANEIFDRQRPDTIECKV